MVSRAFKNVCKKSTAFTSTQRSAERSCRKESTRNTEFTATSDLDNLRQNLLAEGISERASNLITNNRRTPSIKHYKSAWKKWCGWCSEREISPTRSNINYVPPFLADLFKKRLEYRTIGTHRFAISAFHDPIENIRVHRQSSNGICPHVRYIQHEASTTKVSIYLGCSNCFIFSKEASRKWLIIRQITYAESLNVVIIVVCLKGIRDHKFESKLFDEGLSEGKKATSRSEVLRFPRWQETLCMQGNWFLSWKA